MGVAAVWLSAAIQPSLAQTLPSLAENEVLSRVRPGLDPIGLRLGGLRVYPSLSGDVGYDDNVYNVDTDIEKSAIASLRPKVSIQSDWSRHKLALDAQALFERYPDLKTENNNQYSASLSGRMDITGTFQLDGELFGARSVERRGSAGDLFTRGEPIRFGLLGARLNAQNSFGPVFVSVGGSRQTFSYKDARIGADRLDQSYRDHDAAQIDARLGYQIGPGLMAFVQGSHRDEDYDRTAAQDLSSKENAVIAGVRFGITKLISGEIGAGYLRRKYDSGSFGSVSSFTYDGALTWNVTTLVTLTLVGRRSIEESPTLSASGIVTDAIGLTADYELTRRLLINARVDRRSEKYRNMDRHDRRTELSAGFRYLLNRVAELGLRYDRRRQRGAGTLGRDYTGNEVRLSITVQR
jgi:hypothetical protein